MDVSVRLGLQAVCVMVVATALAGCTSEPAPEPPSRVTLPSLTPEERADSVANSIELAWSDVVLSHPAAVRPDIDTIRFVFPNEWAATRAQCLNDVGIAATVSSDGGVVLQVKSGQEEITDLAEFVCAVQYPLDPVANVELNDSQLELSYWYYTHALKDCLEKEGIQVENAPSLSVFKQNFYTTGSWSPYASVPEEGVDWDDLNDRCPQAAPGLYGAGT